MADKSKIPSRQNWNFNSCGDSILDDKQELINAYIGEMLNRTERIFEWDGIPETIPQKDLEFIFQFNGYGFILKNEGRYASKPDGLLYACYGGLGGPCNAYYISKIATIANPWLGYNGQLTVDEDCVCIPNDSHFMGLMPINEKYASLLAETDLSLRIANYNSRIIKVFKARDDNTMASAKEYLKQVEEGQHLGIIGTNAFIEDNFGTEDFASGTDSNHIRELIELQQYLKAQWFIELGLNVNYNMKREAINSAESGMNDDILLPLIDDMLKQRQIGCEKVNKMFGTHWSVKLSSAWEQVAMEQKGEENDASENEGNTSEPADEPR